MGVGKGGRSREGQTRKHHTPLRASTCPPRSTGYLTRAPDSLTGGGLRPGREMVNYDFPHVLAQSSTALEYR